MRQHTILYAYLLLCVVHLYAAHTQLSWLILGTKPLLVSLLAIWFYQQTRPLRDPFPKLILAGLILSVSGDTLLMFVENGPQEEMFFLLGLGSFLIAQVCYAAAFMRYPQMREGLLFRQALWVLPFLAYLGAMLIFLWPGIASAMRLPVAIYAMAIVGMAIAAANLHGRISTTLFWGLLSGVLLFVLSDTLIAINKFVEPIPYARLAIMTTYLGAQFLIAWHTSRLNLQQTSRF